MGVDRTDRSGLRARCKHGRLRLGKGAGTARPRTAPSGASQGGKCCVVGDETVKLLFLKGWGWTGRTGADSELAVSTGGSGLERAQERLGLGPLRAAHPRAGSAALCGVLWES
ncbi:hypothetical protein NDU88_001438 [Pleurodeles waltl]|uniref:Uncharacterized protein n=1 Tax=Pleurodeles waltl TaxID=8319 RepID=A0AAV7Q621_PLEWA|nr:hypothetical protein NDU88_001438 [Pleurodeles waltl]